MRSNEKQPLLKLSVAMAEDAAAPRSDSAFWYRINECMIKGYTGCGFFCISPQHRHNKWLYSECMGEWINQQRCYIVWNATINHSGLMSGRGKGQWCKEQWGEDAPFVVIYYSESIETFLTAEFTGNCFCWQASNFETEPSICKRNKTETACYIWWKKCTIRYSISLRGHDIYSWVCVHSIIQCQSFKIFKNPNYF